MNELATNGSSPFNPSLRMSSVEIAELMKKEHKHVCRDIREMLSKISTDENTDRETAYEKIDEGYPEYDRGSRTQHKYVKPSSFQKCIDHFFEDGPGLDHDGVKLVKDNRGYVDHYLLSFEATMTLITGYDARRRNLVIRRWIDLETGKALPAGAGSAIDTLVKQISSVMNPLVELTAEMSQRILALEERTSRQPALISAAVNHCLVEQVRRFASEECVIRGAAQVRKKALYNAYIMWCSGQGELVERYDLFFKGLYRVGLPVRSAKFRIENDGRKWDCRVIKGMALQAAAKVAA